MHFYPAGDIFDPIWVPGGWDTWHAKAHALPQEHVPSRAAMLAVSDFYDRGFRVVAACACGWEGPLRPSRLQTVVERLATDSCPRCGGQGLELVGIAAPAEIEGEPLDLAADAWDCVDEDPGMSFDAGPDGFDLPPDYGWPEDWLQTTERRGRLTVY